MRSLIVAVVFLAGGWFGHAWWTDHQRELPTVSVTVAPPKVSASQSTRKSAPAAKRAEDTAAWERVQTDAVRTDPNYVTPGIGYYPPPL